MWNIRPEVHFPSIAFRKPTLIQVVFEVAPTHTTTWHVKSKWNGHREGGIMRAHGILWECNLHTNPTRKNCWLWAIYHHNTWTFSYPYDVVRTYGSVDALVDLIRIFRVLVIPSEWFLLSDIRIFFVIHCSTSMSNCQWFIKTAFEIFVLSIECVCLSQPINGNGYYGHFWPWLKMA